MSKTKSSGLLSVIVSLMLWHSPGFPAPSLADLDRAFHRQQWSLASQLAFELSAQDPRLAPVAKIKGAYALFQSGYPYSALFLLKDLSRQDWRDLPKGQERLAGIAALFHKKVPLSVLPAGLDNIDPGKLPESLRNEIRFARGRRAFDDGKQPEALELLRGVSRGSRFFNQARYLIASIALARRDYGVAGAELAKVLEPAVLHQTEEFWKDMGAQVAGHWGTSFKVLLGTDLLASDSQLREMAVLSFARMSYAKKEFETALHYYSKFPRESAFYGRATLERIWTLLALNRHDDAQKIAGELSNEETCFESIEGSPLRALILTDAGRTNEAREELGRFEKNHRQTTEGLLSYQKYKTPESLPSFLQSDLDADARLESLVGYQGSVREEIARLSKEDLGVFPVYGHLSAGLTRAIEEAGTQSARLIKAHAERRLADLERLYLQSRLILAETYLEDREKLRASFHSMGEVSETKREELDKELVGLMEKAVQEVDAARKLGRHRNLALDFRQAELLWELSAGRVILSQISRDNEAAKKDEKAADKLKSRALDIAREIAEKHPKFPKHEAALFFTGFAQIEMEKSAEGQANLMAYVRQYPRAEHVPDAHRILGDSHFDRNDFSSAVAHYRKILEFRDSPIVGYSLYKLGWCFYNLHDYKKAIIALEKAVGWATQPGSKAQLLSLARESRRDLISIYAEVADTKSALTYFRAVFPDDTHAALAELAKALDQTGQFEKAADIYRIVISMRPSAPENVLYQASIIRGMYKLRKWDQATSESGQLAERYGSQISDPLTGDRPEVEAEKILREGALAQHFEYRRAAQGVDVRRVRKLDEHYLAGFGNWPAAQEVALEHAHLLLEMKLYGPSAAAFKSHWIKFAPELKEPPREEALRSLLSALEKAEGEKKGPFTELSGEAQDIVDYSVEYTKQYSAAKYARPIALLRAAMFFKYGLFQLGIEESEKIFDANPRDEFARKAFNNLRTAYYKEKNWAGAITWTKRFLARSDTAAFRKELNQVRGEASFLMAEAMEDKPEEAAAMFLEMSQDPELAWLRQKSLYNAFVRLEKAGKKREAMEVGAILDKEPKAFEGRAQAAGLRAAVYQEAGDYVRALPLLREFLKSPSSEISAEAIAQAKKNVAVISQALDNLGRSRQPASTPAAWATLLRRKTGFVGQPLSAKGDLPARIKKGAVALETLTKDFVDYSKKPESTELALEAYCSLPFIYAAYGKAILGLGKGGAEELKSELAKISAPIAEKAQQLARDCLEKSYSAEHDGPIFRRVSTSFGWESNPRRKEAGAQLLAMLEKKFPWLEAVPSSESEEELLARHLEGKATADTWYALGRARLTAGKYGLSQLTFADAAQKEGKSARLLNALGVAQMASASPGGAGALFESAAREGSELAWLNLGLYHLKARRLNAALTALEKGRGRLDDEAVALLEGVEKE